ncbi:hypothetical protein [Streptomyces sp. 1222.5]|uniref:hypothetical protein n=1 Tax=Streptomyces sp. 1222.5 TaxID=1881026 RepID=UPI003D736039
MFLAAAIAATQTHWWDDWLKFTPGWLVFVWTLGTGVRKAWVRHHKAALGADDKELRAALEAARMRFEDIIAEGRRAPWFVEDERRETGRKIRDLAGRPRDKTLRTELTQVADAWDKVFALAPGRGDFRELYMPHGNLSPQEQQERVRVQEQFGKQADVARGALDHIRAALNCLNELERKTLGR